MPLLRTVGRTAVVAGTATTVAKRVNRRQQGRWAAQEQQQAQPEPAPAAAPAPEQVDPMERLKELGQLHESGVLTDQEFTDAKAKILA
ncbi:MAG: SHOCT domain-containing protein [Solirubrobacteraceae bacterium]